MTALPLQNESLKRKQRIADAMALAVVVAIPWSISATQFFMVLWLIAAGLALKVKDIRREMVTLAGGMPVLFALLGVLGMMWAPVGWAERLGGADSFLKLVAIPVLFAQFRRSGRAHWPLMGFITSCAVLLVLFWATTIRDAILLKDATRPVQSSDYAVTELGEFIICGFALLLMRKEPHRQKHWPEIVGIVGLASGFLAAVLYVMVSPSRWFALPVELIFPSAALLLFFTLKQFNVRVMLVVGGAIACVVLYAASPVVQNPLSVDALLGISRPVYWAKSLHFIADAPIFGHGTGSIRFLFEQSAEGQTGPMAEIVSNPFQETLAVGIQLGIIGIGALWTMWISHLRLFRTDSPANWIGCMIMLYIIVSSLADAELFDAHRGWLYVFGVGIAGGASLREWVAKDIEAVPAL